MKFEFDEQLSKVFRAVKAIGAEVTGMAPNKEFATNVGVETYGKESELGGKADAMRHITFSALASQQYSEPVAKTISVLNENITYNQSPAEKSMDYANDAIGRDIAKKAKYKDEIVQMAKEAIDSGKAKTISDNTGPYY
jgi:hypothetical protein